jgi:hypothetical protein
VAVERLCERCDCTEKEGQDILHALREMGLSPESKKKKKQFFFFFFLFFLFIFRTRALSLPFIFNRHCVVIFSPWPAAKRSLAGCHYLL